MTDIAAASHRSPTMLIADDDPAVVRLLADRFTSVGFQVETATNGMQALIRAHRSQPDILIIDVNMPGADGLSVCARLLAPGGKPSEVVVVTGSADSETVGRCESLGAFYVHKGPHFWSNIASALTKLFPGMADNIMELETQPMGAEARGRPRVLVLDHDPDTETFLSSRLDKCGVETSYASDAVQGYRIACKMEPSVIISDYLLPNGGANYLLWRLRTTPSTANVPVFLMSERQLDESTKQSLMREVCGHPGVALFFRKPLDIGELFAALQQHCAFQSPVSA